MQAQPPPPQPYTLTTNDWTVPTPILPPLDSLGEMSMPLFSLTNIKANIDEGVDDYINEVSTYKNSSLRQIKVIMISMLHY